MKPRPLIPAPSTLRAGIGGAVESQHSLAGADFSSQLGRRTALLFQSELIQRLAQRRAQANIEATKTHA